MIKRTIIFIFTSIIIITLANIPHAYAGEASISINGPVSISPGERADYTITLNVSDGYAALATISCSGTISGSGNIHWDSPDGTRNGSGFSSVTITVDAGTGEGTGTISVSGSGTALDESGNLTTFEISGTGTITVSESISNAEPTAVGNVSPATKTEDANTDSSGNSGETVEIANITSTTPESADETTAGLEAGGRIQNDDVKPGASQGVSDTGKIKISLFVYLLSIAATALISVYLTIFFSRIAISNHRKRHDKV